MCDSWNHRSLLQSRVQSLGTGRSSAFLLEVVSRCMNLASVVLYRATLPARVVFGHWDWPLLISLSQFPCPFWSWHGWISICITTDTARGNERKKVLPVVSPALLIDSWILNPSLWTKLLGLRSGKFFSPHPLHLLKLPSEHRIPSMWVDTHLIVLTLTTVNTRRCESPSGKLRKIITKMNTCQRTDINRGKLLYTMKSHSLQTGMYGLLSLPRSLPYS